MSKPLLTTACARGMHDACRARVHPQDGPTSPCECPCGHTYHRHKIPYSLSRPDKP